MIFIQKTPKDGYTFAGTRSEGAGFGSFSGVSTLSDVQRKLAIRGITSKAMKPILEELETKGSVTIPIAPIA
jgi:hypothetical protein